WGYSHLPERHGIRGLGMKDGFAFPTRPLPKLARIRQRVLTDHIADVRKETRQKLLDAGLHEKLKPGASVAITAGSRGMCGIVDAVQSVGGKPFFIPAMGSHGAARAEGQTEILRRLGVTADTVAAPIRATMDTIELGTAKSGAVAH